MDDANAKSSPNSVGNNNTVEKVAKSVLKDGYYGNLTKTQETCLQKTKEALQKGNPTLPERYDDVRLCRFLRARNFDVQKTTEMVQNDIKWRAEFGADTIMETFPKTKYYKRILEYWPQGHHKLDKSGVPFSVERLGQADPRSLIGNVPSKDLIQYHVYCMEETEQMISVVSKKLGSPYQDGILEIEDLNGLGWKHMFVGGLGVFREVTDIDQLHYPESLKKMIIVNPPSILSMFWVIITPWLNKRTLEKLEVVSSDHITVLKEYIEFDSIPAFLGGGCKSCKNDCSPGTGGIFGSGEPDPNRKEITINAAGKFEEVVKIEKENTSILWEFKILSKDVAFSVHYENESKERIEVVKSTKYDCGPEVSGSYNCTKTGCYVLQFDNSYSRWTKKQITYQIYLEAIQDMEQAMISN